MNQCCQTCGFLKENFGKPSPKGVRSNVDWYCQDNINRLWEELRDSGICHSTDPNAHEYGGKKGIKEGNEHVCIGAVRIIFIHAKILEKLEDYNKYVATVGGKKYALTRKSMAEFIVQFGIGRTGFFGGAKLPATVNYGQEIIYPDHFEKALAYFNANIKPQLENAD
jgi:hypothetical protein